MKLKQVREQKVKRLQVKLAQKIQKQKWFADRELSIETESLKLEEEGKQIRRSGGLRRLKEIEAFLENLAEAHRAIGEKKLELTAEIIHLQGELETASTERKVVEKLEELHYNQRVKKRRKREG